MRWFGFVNICLIILPYLSNQVLWASEPRDNALTRDEVSKLLLADKSPWTNSDKIIALGHKVVPGLIEVLNTSENGLEIDRALTIAVHVGLDKQKFVSPLLRLVKSPNMWIRIRALQTLGEFEAVNVSDEVLPLINDKGEFVRVTALETLGKIGDEQAAIRIEQVLNERKKGLTEQQVRNDWSFEAGYTAIEAIKKRMATHNPAPKPKP